MVTTAEVKAYARELEFDRCGVAPAGSFPELAFLREWIDAGYAGAMQYMARGAHRRADARAVLPSARSVIALASVYHVDRPYSIEATDPGEALIGRYAWGDDYHEVLGRRLEALVNWMHERCGPDLETRAYVDTGPVLERVYAQYAGLGWIGKNTCLINPDLGSWLFLSEILCNLELEADAPAFDQCGTCTLCLEACPTGAFVAPRVLDARRCISYLTIELKGAIPEEQREQVGAHAYGCDVCQEVCPWNQRPALATLAEWQPRSGLDRPSLLGLWRRSDADLRTLLRGSAMRRAGVRGLRRNLAVAIGNSGDPAAAAVFDEPRPPDRAPTMDDPMVAEHVAWARRALTGES